MKLYDASLSPNARRVRAVAFELGLDLEMVPVNMAAGEHRSDAFRAMNPNGKVPVLVDGDFVLWESNAILCYLAAKKPEAGLLPGDPRGRAEVDRWLFWQAAHFGPAVGRVVFEKLVKPMFGGTPDPKEIDTGTAEFARYAPVLEAALQGREYVAGRLSVADFSLAANADTAPMVGLDLAPYPNIRGWLERLGARDSWKKSAPQLPPRK